MPSVSKPSQNNRRHVVLFKLGVTTIKGTLFSRLKIEERGAGYCHFPLDAKNAHRGYDSVYFKGLLSERMVIKRVKGRDTITWEPRSPGIRNEPLDTRVYATGALELFNPNFEKHAKRRNKKAIEKPLPKLKEPEIQDKTEERIAPEIQKPVLKRTIQTSNAGIFRRGLRM